MFKFKNQVKNYAWGSKTSISELFGIENHNHEPQAEVWMGANLGGSSVIAEIGQAPSSFIAENMGEALDAYKTSRFGDSPFLLKVLVVGCPLSIQVNPNVSVHQALLT
ncbi:Mannose-6-phosphate isomerase [Vibrio mediterranei]|uniref:type I phosphomannose isomerase catalytic subunit n=1 Tax=Vibrio mediterranei TaxID=689 RepID=UPI000780606C|nr:type I phosphomannose isomerase catalytic subunit [Vibrio mediterranei]SBO12211.1 Mannose-6-phosphate isomerase [Vibrio mediterranei]